MSAEADIAAVRDFIERAWNAGDEAVFTEHLAPGIDHPGGREGFKRMLLGFRAAFRNLAMDVTTRKGEFLGVAATGRRVAFDGIAIDVMRDGLRVGGWAQLDLLGLLVQLGAVDAPR